MSTASPGRPGVGTAVPAEQTLRRPHVFVPGTGGRPLLLLHGTGADENDLLGLGRGLSPTSPLLSPRGTVLESGMPRFFRRLAEGVFDEDDLRARTDELASFLRTASVEYGLAVGSVVAVGFSNGANIASALMMRHPGLLRGAVLFGAMVPFAGGPAAARDDGVPAELAGTRVLVVNGRRDPIVSAAQTDTVVAHLRSAGAEVTRLDHDGGHSVPAQLLPDIAAAVTALG